MCEIGFLNGQLAVSRAVGDFHVDDLKRKKDGSPGPLIADPDIHIHLYEADDEFVLMASDGLWDVFSSQGAVTFARGRLQVCALDYIYLLKTHTHELE